MLARNFIDAEKFDELFLLVADLSPENGGILVVLLAPSLLMITLFFELKLKKIYLFSQYVYGIGASLQLVWRDFELITALVLLEDGALVGQLAFTGGKLGFDLLIKQYAFL